MHYKLLAFPKKRFYNDELFSFGSANFYVKSKVADFLKEILELEKSDTEYIGLLLRELRHAVFEYKRLICQTGSRIRVEVPMPTRPIPRDLGMAKEL
ncbi:hypothetical protein SLS57_000032 [Botryosphaeria dothidea]